MLKLKKKTSSLWEKYYTKQQMKITSPNKSIYQLMEETAISLPHNVAIN